MRPFTLLSFCVATAITGALAQKCTATVTVYVTSTVSAHPSPSSPHAWPNVIPEIDVCGPSHGVSCPGVGPGGYFYRCCSSKGHCGPKNVEQDSAQYCGAGCQARYGLCDPSRPRPPKPDTPPSISTDSRCGPIVNKKCPTGQCCSGSNFCGTGPDFCGAANWCQVDYGHCER